MTPNELSDRLWHFAARVSKVVDALPATRTGRHVAAQLIRCGTAAAPNYDEGRVALAPINLNHTQSDQTSTLADFRRVV